MLSPLPALMAACLAAAPPGARSAADVQRRVAGLAASLAARGGGVAGVSAVELATGRRIAAVRADRLFTPASNQKLLTSAFALVRLGASFRFATGVLLAGNDLVVAGEGDPTLGDPRLAAERGTSVYDELDRWAAAVRKRAGPGVRDVLLCEPYPPPGRHDDWPDNQRTRWYAAPVSTLNFHDNCFDVTFQNAGGGLRPVIHPQSRLLRIVSRLRLGAEQAWSLRTADEDATLVLSGTVKAASPKPTSVAVDHPALLLGRTFVERLIRAGVTVTGRLRRVTPRDVEWSAAECLCRTATPLFAAMKRSNKNSLSMAAEAMFLRAGDGTWAGSAEMMARTLTAAFDLPAGSIRAADGGGLSANNRVSPEAMTKLLVGVAARPDGVLLLRSLPLAGIEGTLAKRFADPACRGRVVAKTGYIRHVSCLSGYVLDETWRARIAFSVLVNDIPGSTARAKRLQEDICRVLIDAIPPAATSSPTTAAGGG